MGKTDAASVPLRHPPADEFLIIRNFMIAEGGLGLTGTQAYVYALIYRFSVDGKGAFFGSLACLSSRCGISRHAAILALRVLKERGLIAEYGVRSNGSRTKRCYAVSEKDELAKSSYEEYWARRSAGEKSAPTDPPLACFGSMQKMRQGVGRPVQKVRLRARATVHKMHRPSSQIRRQAGETIVPIY